MKKQTLSVLISGSGPVGLAIAALLCQQGVSVRIIDKNTGPTDFSKAIGMHARTLESMYALELSEKLLEDGHPLHAFRINEAGHSIMSASFDDIGSPFDFVLGIPQCRTERRLLARLEEVGGCVEWGTRLVAIDQLGQPEMPDQPALVRVEHADGREETIACNWVIGADGGHSAVRQMAGIGFEGSDFGKAFILGDVKIDWQGPQSELQFFLSQNGYLLVIPMPEGMYRIIAQTDKQFGDFREGQRPVATLEELQRIVDANGPGNIRVHSPNWLTCAPFYQRQADIAQKQRIVLAGDAFHLFSPLGAQGLNTGFQDGFNLAWKLAYIEKGWASASLIQTYQSERERIARAIAQVTAKTTRYITATSLPQRMLRRLVTPLFNRTQKVQKLLPRLLGGLLQTYGTDARLSGPSAPGLPLAGSRIPHAWLPQDHGQQPLASLVHGKSFTLLLVKDRMDDMALEKLKNFCTPANLARYPFLQIAVVTRESAAWQSRLPKACSMIDDRFGSVARALNEDREAIVLSRPDGFCAMSVKGWDLAQVEKYFSERGLDHAGAAANLNDTFEEYRHAA